MKKTLELTLCESEGIKIEVSCEVLRIETDNPAIHPDDPNQSTVTEYWCKDVEWFKLNGITIPFKNSIIPFENSIRKELGNLVEQQLESNPKLFEG
jgi:hypothetical protein